MKPDSKNITYYNPDDMLPNSTVAARFVHNARSLMVLNVLCICLKLVAGILSICVTIITKLLSLPKYMFGMILTAITSLMVKVLFVILMGVFVVTYISTCNELDLTYLEPFTKNPEGFWSACLMYIPSVVMDYVSNAFHQVRDYIYHLSTTRRMLP